MVFVLPDHVKKQRTRRCLLKTVLFFTFKPTIRHSLYYCYIVGSRTGLSGSVLKITLIADAKNFGIVIMSMRVRISVSLMAAEAQIADIHPA